MFYRFIGFFVLGFCFFVNLSTQVYAVQSTIINEEFDEEGESAKGDKPRFLAYSGVEKTLNELLIERNFTHENGETFLAFANENRLLQDFDLVSEKNIKPVITIGYEHGFGVLADTTSYHNKGLGFDLLNKVGHFAGVEFKFVEVDGSLFEAVQNNIVDIAGFYALTPEREEKVAFGSVSIDLLQMALATKGDKGILYGDPSAIDGKTVATYPGNPGEKILNSFLEEHNISVNYIYDNVREYDKLEADFYLMVSDKKTDEAYNTVLNLGLENLYFFTKKSNEKLIKYLDSIIYNFMVDNYGAYIALLDKYRHAGNEFQNRSLTREEADLLKGKTFRVGYSDNHAPYQSQNLRGEPEGIAVEYINLLAEKYGFNIEYIPFNIEHSWSIFEDLDLLISLVGERNHVSRFYTGTDPYYSMDMNIIFQENYAQKENAKPEQHGLPSGAKVGIFNYINFRYGDFFLDFPDTEIVHFTNSSDIIDSFVDQNLNAIVATNIGTNTLATLVGHNKFQTNLGSKLDLNFQISKKISDEYLEIFNIIINREPKSTINAIVTDEAAKHLPEFGAEQFVKNNLNLLLGGAAVLAFIVFALIKMIRQRSTISTLAKDDITTLSSLTKFTDDVDALFEKNEIGIYELIILDIDYFRMINNYYGTDKGTEVIQAMAEALQDAYKGLEVYMARRVAEQFLIVKKIDEGRSIEEVVNAFIIPRVKAIVGETYSLNMSIGYCKHTEKGEKMTSMLDNANLAHQKAKKVHRTTFQEFTEEMRKEAITMLDIIYRMEHALENKEFKVHYQPKIAFDSLTITGAEALVRWIPPIGNPIYPNDFIPVMEKNGFISQLELYIFEDVCRFLKEGGEDIQIPKIAVNVSPITLSNAALLKQMVEILKKYKVKPSQIEIEITESAIGAFEETLPMIIKILHKIGFTVAMDDFGAGNSSLNRLSVIDVDVLKLDKVFLDFHEDAPRGSLVVEQVINLGKQLGMKIVAEGIEGKDQAKWLKDIQCDIAQGFYFAKVLKEDDFKALLLERKQYSVT